jgi:LysM repeat protein
MRQTLPILALILLCFSVQLAGQNTPKPAVAPILTPKDTLLLVITGGKKYVMHPVKPKQTLFSISKYYSISLPELFDLNTFLRLQPTLKAGTKLKIPIPNKAIKRYRKDTPLSKLVPIWYVVQEGDNLYQICKHHFMMPVDSVQKRNHLKGVSIKPGQRLLVAWMGVDGILQEWRTAQQSQETGVLKTRYEQEKDKHKEVDTQGVCFWQKDSKEKGELYALHREAALGTIIAVTNPIYKRTVFAKVIGRIPDGYEKNVEVILAPEAARHIGAKDPRFFVKIKYLK